jgi:hypothetical protein
MNYFKLINSTLKTVIISSIILITTFLIWFNLPFTWHYSGEIKSGNLFVKNIRNYQIEHKDLPNEGDCETLKQLNRVENYEVWFPEYRKKGNDEFTLTFVKGFDPPYLIYDSSTDKWEYRFPN